VGVKPPRLESPNDEAPVTGELHFCDTEMPLVIGIWSFASEG